MSESFAANARRLAGRVGRQCGWVPENFWQATPAEIATILGEDQFSADGSLDRNQLEALMERDRNG